MALFAQQTTEIMGSQNFLWVANNDQADELFLQDNAQRISNVSHGLNCYKTKNNIAFMSALNPSPGHIKYLKHLGLTDNEIRTAGSNQTMYQCVLRTSIRDLSSTDEKLIIVPDLQAALYLQKMFPNATVSQCIACTETVKKVGRRKKKTALTSAERVRKHRAKKKSEQDMLKTNYANAR
jgi:hypothetical protein